MKYFKQLGRFTLLITMATATIPAHAVWYGEEVSQENAPDYQVFVTGNSRMCSGQIIAGKYVITAAHCVMSYGADYRNFILARKGITDVPERIDDKALLESVLTREEFAYDIYFGSNEQFGGKRVEVSEIITNPYYVWEYRYGAFTDKRKQLLNDFNSDLYIAGDLTIFKLSETVQQETASILDVGDIISPAGKGATLTGWGLNEDGYTESNLHKIQFAIGALPSNLGIPDGLSRRDGNTHPLAKSSYDYPTLRRVDDGNGNLQQSDKGDSGSPVISNGFTLGFVSGGTKFEDGSEGTGMTGPAYWIKNDPWIARHIDAVNTVSKVALSIDSDFTTKEWVIPVQSLKLNDVEINSTANLLNNSDNGFAVNSDCNPILKTGDYCSITLTYNGLDASGTLVLKEGDIARNVLVINETLQIPIAIIYPNKPVIPPVIPPVTPPTNEKSGGSFGGFASLMIFIELIRRRLTIYQLTSNKPCA